MIALIDYGAGNLHSVEKALLKVGAKVVVATEKSPLKDAHGLVLPGVGAFDDCINALHKQGLFEPIKEFIQSGKPYLGICLGYQILFEKSEEFNSKSSGFAIFKGNVIRFTSRQGHKIPQIGWNQIILQKKDCPLYDGIKDGSYFYFVHSYYPEPADKTIVATLTEYGDIFASSIWDKNVFAVQFHPEKSQNVGLRLLKNFVELCV